MPGLAPPPGEAAADRHAGPVRALAVSEDGGRLLSAGFDAAVILRAVGEGGLAPLRSLRPHDAPASGAVAAGGRFATAGDDGRLLVWDADGRLVARAERAVEGAVLALAAAATPDGRGLALAIAGPDRRLWLYVVGREPGSRGTGLGTAQAGPADARALDPARPLGTAAGAVTALALAPGSGPSGLGTLAVGTAEGVELHRLDRPEGGAPRLVPIEGGATRLAFAPDGELLVGTATGRVEQLAPDGTRRGGVEVGELPVTALAVSADGTLVAAGGVRGAVSVIERASGARVATLVGPGLPVWSLAFHPDGRRLFTGGADGQVREWNARTGEPAAPAMRPAPEATEAILAAASGERGAQVFRACVACHGLTPGEAPRAGPTLHGVFGRRIATLPGYPFSEPLKRMDIVWSRDTISKLFEIGPNAYTPGTKMPEQTLGDPADRAALVEWLERVTR